MFWLDVLDSPYNVRTTWELTPSSKHLRSGDAVRLELNDLNLIHLLLRTINSKNTVLFSCFTLCMQKTDCRPNAVVPAHALAPSNPKTQTNSFHVQVRPKPMTQQTNHLLHAEPRVAPMPNP